MPGAGREGSDPLRRPNLAEFIGGHAVGNHASSGKEQSFSSGHAPQRLPTPGGQCTADVGEEGRESWGHAAEEQSPRVMRGRLDAEPATTVGHSDMRVLWDRKVGKVLSKHIGAVGGRVEELHFLPQSRVDISFEVANFSRN